MSPKCACSLILLGFVSQSLAASYYVANHGSDSNHGTSIELAWRSPAKVSSFRFQSGDQILFKGGESFQGPIQLAAEDSGQSASPLEIKSFGDGRATLRAGLVTGIHARNVEHLSIQPEHRNSKVRDVARF